MQHYKSEHSFGKRNSQLILPKIASNDIANTHTRRSSLANLHKSKRSLVLLKDIKPAKDIRESSDSDDTSMIAKRIMTPTKKKAQAQVAVLSLNRNKKERPKNRFMKQIFVGEQAVQKFYDRYKHIDKYRDKQHFLNQNNPVTQIVQLLQAHGYAPRKLDVIKLKGSHAILDLRKLGLGHGGMGNVVTELMSLMSNFQYIDLSSNQIDRLLSQHLVPELKNVKIIHLSSNRIGKIGCDKFAQLFYNPKTKIQELYLNDNNLMDNAGAVLVSSLAQYTDLRVLSLTKNFMGNKFAQQLRQYLSKDDMLEQLYLGWNQFGDKAAKIIFQSIEKHPQLKVFDYSWNIIGIFSVDALSQLLRQNQTLIHMDISFCQIEKKYAIKLANALQKNHTIYGFHFEGNSGFIDHRGFLKPTQKQFKDYPLPIVRGVIRSIDSIHPNPILNSFKESHLADICWICQSWQEMYFKIKKDDEQVEECYLHLENQGFKAIKMQLSDGYFETYRMLPMKNHKYFFTFSKGPGKRIHFASKDAQIVAIEDVTNLKIGDTQIAAMIPEMNINCLHYLQDPVDQNYFANVHCVPRSQQVRANFKQVRKVIVKVKRKVVREHKLNMKFRELDEKGGQDFLNDKYDTDGDLGYLMKCLEFDIANSKIIKLIKNQSDLQDFKQMMINYYCDFKDAFYHLASTYPGLTGVFSIPELPFNAFLEEQKYVTKRVTHAKIMLKMISCLSVNEDISPEKKGNDKMGKQKKQNQTMKLFVRPQFLQFLIRLALQKWCTAPPKPKKKKDDKKQEEKKQDEEQQQSPTRKQKIKLPLPLIQGLQRTMKTLTKYANRVKASNWRKQKYLVIDNYTVIKGYQHFLLDLFDRSSSGKKKLDKPKKLKGLLTLDQCRNIFVDTEIKRTKQATKDMQIPFLESKRLQIQDGIIQYGLNFDQFCQFLARYSQILWFPPIASEQHQLWEHEGNRRVLPLFIRFQSLIVNIYRRKIDMHNRKMDRIVKKGLFEPQTQILIEKVIQMDVGDESDLAFKMNSLDPEDQITLKGLIDGLRQKYENAVVQKQQQISEEEEREEYD